jgi:1-acyl-sn-glycerol-3-phosphate acyltransferase
VVVANHSAMVDGPLLYGLLGRRSSFLIKQEMFRGPLGWILPRIGQLAVRRGEVDRAPLLTAVRLLRGVSGGHSWVGRRDERAAGRRVAGPGWWGDAAAGGGPRHPATCR